MTGVIIGKFYPPHRGHKFLIDSALSQVDSLTVIVCEHPDQNLPGELRAEWLREIHPGLRVVITPDDLPDQPGPWSRRTIEILGRKPDKVFTSEEYGWGYAEAMGCEHVCVDLARHVVPISATAIRANPLEHLDSLEPCVRAHFVKRVVLIGVESTGKTALAQELARRLETNWVEEYGREYSLGKTKWETADFEAIAAEQQQRENLAARTANRILICDTNATATSVWHRRYMGSYSKAVDAVANKDRADLYLLAMPDFPFVQDGTRDGEFIRDEMHQWFVERLSGLSVEVIELTGGQDQRAEFALKVIHNRFLR